MSRPWWHRPGGGGSYLRMTSCCCGCPFVQSSRGCKVLLTANFTQIHKRISIAIQQKLLWIQCLNWIPKWKSAQIPYHLHSGSWANCENVSARHDSWAYFLNFGLDVIDIFLVPHAYHRVRVFLRSFAWSWQEKERRVGALQDRRAGTIRNKSDHITDVAMSAWSCGRQNLH